MVKKLKFSELQKQINKIDKKWSNCNVIINKYKNKLTSIDDIKNNHDFYLALSLLTAQQKSIKQENRICQLLNGKKLNPLLERGDFVDKDGRYWEIKCSTPSKEGNILNLVQIRLHHDVDFYLCVFIDDVNYETNYVFKLTKQQMAYECKIIGASAHGIKNINKLDQEWRISLNLFHMNINLTRWLRKYRCFELESKIF